MLILQDQKLFESLALKKQKEKLQTPLSFFDVLVKFCPQCIHGSQLVSRHVLTHPRASFACQQFKHLSFPKAKTLSKHTDSRNLPFYIQ